MSAPRTLIFLTLSAAAGAFALGRTFSAWPESGRSAAGSERAAWALLAEASELCAPEARAGDVPLEAARPPAARQAVGKEAVRIAREHWLGIESEAARSALEGAFERLEACCENGALGEGGCRPVTQLEEPPGAGDRDTRNAVVASYLERLNEAASRAIERGEAERLAAGEEASATGPAGRAPAAAEGRDQIATERTAPQAAPENPGEAPAIAVGGASRRYLERVRRWAPVFAREAALLRRARRRLQIEIDRHSMGRSRAACRAFGAELDRLDAGLATGAPTRGLALAVERMLFRYRRGAAECAAGRPAAAFGHLDEGDREWASVAATAAGLLDPRPMRADRTNGSELGDRAP